MSDWRRESVESLGEGRVGARVSTSTSSVAASLQYLTTCLHVQAVELRPGGGGGGKRAIVAAKRQAAAPRLRPHPHRAAPCCRG